MARINAHALERSCTVNGAMAQSIDLPTCPLCGCIARGTYCPRCYATVATIAQVIARVESEESEEDSESDEEESVETL
jgi:hypothetical protein